MFEAMGDRVPRRSARAAARRRLVVSALATVVELPDESTTPLEAALVAEDPSRSVEITTDAATTLPLPPAPLRVILRELLSNAVAAGAGHVHLTAARSSFWSRLRVDDDGVALAAVDRDDAGSGLGLSLCGRVAARFGGALEVAALPSGGARATLTCSEALA
jgi:signal transduction histidine kinase